MAQVLGILALLPGKLLFALPPYPRPFGLPKLSLDRQKYPRIHFQSPNEIL